MEGPEDTLPTVSEEGEMVDRRGMISRAVEQVFSSAIQMRETGWEVGYVCMSICQMCEFFTRDHHIKQYALEGPHCAILQC